MLLALAVAMSVLWVWIPPLCVNAGWTRAAESFIPLVVVLGAAGVFLKFRSMKLGMLSCSGCVLREELD